MKSLLKLIQTVLIFVIILICVQFAYTENKKLPIKPFSPTKEGVWKIERFWTTPACYTLARDKDTTVRINAIFECKGESLKSGTLSCKDLNLKFHWKSNIEEFTKEINLTQAIKSSCNPNVSSCRVKIDNETVDVKLMFKENKISITKMGYISPKVAGAIDLIMEAYTDSILTDKKSFKLMPCTMTAIPQSGSSSAGYDATVDFAYAGPNFIKITITDLDKARATTIRAYVSITNPAFSGELTFTEDTTNFGVFSIVYPFTWTQGISCKVVYTDELTSTGDRNVQRIWTYVVP